jgi:hypothetical protein
VFNATVIDKVVPRELVLGADRLIPIGINVIDGLSALARNDPQYRN